MATLTATALSRAGIDLTGAAATVTTGDDWINTGAEVLLVKNGDTNPTTLTIAIPATLDGQAVASRTVAVPAGKTYAIGPFPPNIYNVSATGKVSVVASSVTSLTLFLVKVA